MLVCQVMCTCPLYIILNFACTLGCACTCRYNLFFTAFTLSGACIPGLVCILGCACMPRYALFSTAFTLSCVCMPGFVCMLGYACMPRCVLFFMVLTHLVMELQMWRLHTQMHSYTWLFARFIVVLPLCPTSSFSVFGCACTSGCSSC